MQGRSGLATEKEEPGNYWAVGHRSIDLAPGLTVGRELPYELAYLKRANFLFHSDTMEPFNPKRIFMDDDDDPWQELRWDPRDLDEEVTRNMRNAKDAHPGLKAMVEESNRQDTSRASAHAATVSWLARSLQSSKKKKGSKSRQSEAEIVLSPESANFSDAVVAAAHKSERAPVDDGAVKLLCEAGSFSWAGENEFDLLGVRSGRFSVSARDWDPTVGVDADYGAAGGAALHGCWWLHEQTRGSFERLRLLHRQILTTDAELEFEALSCVTLCGAAWTLDACSVFGGGREVLSARWDAEVSLRHCVLADAPPLPDADAASEPLYFHHDEVYNRTAPLDGVPRRVDGVACFDTARVRVEGSLFGESLLGGIRAYDESVAVVSNCTFANMEVGVEAANCSRVAVASACFVGCEAALLAQHRASLLGESCSIRLARLGLAIHDSATVAIRASRFDACIDGAFFSGLNAPAQRLELRGNVVSCVPHDGIGLAWLSLQRPGKLVEKGNRVENDAYYPKSKDVAEENGMEWEQLQKWVSKQIEELYGKQPHKESILARKLGLRELVEARRQAATFAPRRKTTEEQDVTARVGAAPLTL